MKLKTALLFTLIGALLILTFTVIVSANGELPEPKPPTGAEWVIAWNLGVGYLISLLVNKCKDYKWVRDNPKKVAGGFSVAGSILVVLLGVRANSAIWLIVLSTLSQIGNAIGGFEMALKKDEKKEATAQ